MRSQMPDGTATQFAAAYYTRLFHLVFAEDRLVRLQNRQKNKHNSTLLQKLPSFHCFFHCLYIFLAINCFVLDFEFMVGKISRANRVRVQRGLQAYACPDEMPTCFLRVDLSPPTVVLMQIAGVLLLFRHKPPFEFYSDVASFIVWHVFFRLFRSHAATAKYYKDNMQIKAK